MIRVNLLNPGLKRSNSCAVAPHRPNLESKADDAGPEASGFRREGGWGGWTRPEGGLAACWKAAGG